MTHDGVKETGVLVLNPMLNDDRYIHSEKSESKVDNPMLVNCTELEDKLKIQKETSKHDDLKELGGSFYSPSMITVGRCMCACTFVCTY
jgi:hypothetical protein